MTPTWALVCLVATALSCLADAQSYQKPPQRPQNTAQQWPQPKPVPQNPQPPQVPQWKPAPMPPQNPQPPQVPQWKPAPMPPQNPQPPQVPQWKPAPMPPQNPQPPQVPQPPQFPQPPQVPKWKPALQPPQVLQPPQGPAPQWPPKNPHPPQNPPKQVSRHQTPSKPQTQQTQRPPTNTSPPEDPVQSCEVEDAYKINCGPADISAGDCGAINCCFDGRMCFYGKAVTVQCTKDAQFIVVVSMDATLPNIDLESVSLLGDQPGCGLVGKNSRFAIYQFPVTGCGTVTRDELGVVVYENRMSSLYEVGVGPYGSITRDTTYELLFQCRYIGVSVEALVIEVVLNEVPQPIAALGPIRVELLLANGVCTQKGCYEEDVAYNSFYNAIDYPVVKVLRDPVYVQVQLLGRSDPSLTLSLGRCWTTTTPDPQSFPQWDLLNYGCPYRDDRYQTSLKIANNVEFPSHYQRFVFKMFTFVDQSDLSPLREKVFIHCTTTVCVGANCQPRCSRKEKRDAGKATQRFIESPVMVSSMEVQFVSGEQTS